MQFTNYCCKLKHSLPQNVLFTVACKYDNVSKAEQLSSWALFYVSCTVSLVMARASWIYTGLVAEYEDTAKAVESHRHE